MKQFIAKLEDMGALVRIKEYVDPVLEIAEITDRMSKQSGGGKALLFENTGTGFPVLTNMMGSTDRMAAALGVTQVEHISQRMEQLLAMAAQPLHGWKDKLKLLPSLRQAASWMPKKIKGPGACQEVVYMEPDLSLLPILQCWPHDGGRFITLPLVHTQDPETGGRNVGMYRMQVFGKDSTGMHWHKHKTGARHFAAGKNPRFPVAVCLGGDPVYTFCAAAPLPDGIDEYMLAGFLRDRAVSLVPCLSIELMVPEDCDFVLEGYIETKEKPLMEGPFGDHTGFYSLPDLYPVFHLSCITHRKGAIYPATLVGIPPQEDAYIADAIEKIFLTPFRLSVVPEALDLHLPAAGVSHNIAVVKIRKSYAGQAIKTAHALWGAGQMMFNKMAVIVNDNIDIRDQTALWNTILRHYRPERDTFFSRGPLDVLDHAAPKCGFGGKICIDATKKYPEEESPAGQALAPDRVFSFVHKPESKSNALIEVQLDSAVDLSNSFICLWLMGNNADPIRDMNIEGGVLRIDARTKKSGSTGGKGASRPWPNVVCSSPKTIKAVDDKWESLGLGDFIPSPSLTYRTLVRPGGASILD
ncbi:MAG: menaquinone biosynthesis decarboxylase [Bacteroidales bacterium]|nr:menaquinone biosynthesis decarboxylase [Bacteroidales bacterium]